MDGPAHLSAPCVLYSPAVPLMPMTKTELHELVDALPVRHVAKAAGAPDECMPTALSG